MKNLIILSTSASVRLLEERQDTTEGDLECRSKKVESTLDSTGPTLGKYTVCGNGLGSRDFRSVVHSLRSEVGLARYLIRSEDGRIPRDVGSDVDFFFFGSDEDEAVEAEDLDFFRALGFCLGRLNSRDGLRERRWQ